MLLLESKPSGAWESLQSNHNQVYDFWCERMREKSGITIFVTGTDTDCGKTVISAGLLAAAIIGGIPVMGIKAVQTGCELRDGRLISPDADFYKAVAPEVESVMLMGFEDAVSPHLAARREGRFIDASSLSEMIANRGRGKRLVVVEGAGGVLVPLNSRETVADMMKLCASSVVLVVSNKLGAVNHALLSIELLRSRRIPVSGFVAIDASPPCMENALNAVTRQENPRIISDISGVACLAEVPFLAGLNSGSNEERRDATKMLAGLMLPVVNRLLAEYGV